MRILVAGIGNIFHGDDAFGCEVTKSLLERAWPEGVRVEDFGIRSYDLAFAIADGWDAVLLVDALPRGRAPGTLYLLEVDAEAADQGGLADAHSMSPVLVLRMVQALGGVARRVHVVGCEPAMLEADDIGLSEPVRAAVPGAVEMVTGLVGELMEQKPAQPACASNPT